MSTLTHFSGSKLSRILLACFVVLAVFGGVSVLSAASTVAVASTGGAPTITVTAVILNPVGVTCGIEIDCARVTWTAAIPNGTTLSGYTVVLKVTRTDGKSETNTKPAAASALQLDMPAAFQTGVDNVKSFFVTVTANYTSTAAGTKTGNF